MAFWMLQLLTLALVFLLRKLRLSHFDAGSARMWIGRCDEQVRHLLGILMAAFSDLLTKKLDERSEQEWLQRALSRLRATLVDANRNRIKGELPPLRIQEVKDVACEVEDVLDELAYDQLRWQMEGKGGSRALASSLARKVKKIKQRFRDIEDDKKFQGIADVGGRADQEEVTQPEMTQQTSSLPIEPEIFGRKKEKEDIITFLLAPGDDGDYGGVVSIAAIAGMGGLGKTTLAQLVYNDERVVKHFKPRMWIWTTPDVDVTNITREILGSMNMDAKIHWNSRNLNRYHEQIIRKLKGKRFLLVLDNVWDKDLTKWRRVFTPLFYANEGSKVLITTRDAMVAKNMQCGMTIGLKGLPFEDCRKLFERHAFPDGASPDNRRLETMIKQIVDKFKGIPLAAAMVGDVLRSTPEDENEWRRILKSEIWEIDLEEGDIQSVLRLSYDRLSLQLKNCFVYCSLYPRNYRFIRSDLVQQWMAQGFVQSEGSRRAEDIGNRCFDDLLRGSFFQVVDGNYVMHDFIHDFAVFVSQHDHSRTGFPDSSCTVIPRGSLSIRHLSLKITSAQPNLQHLKILLERRHLRTLLFWFRKTSISQVPKDLFLSLDTLRVLDLSYGGIKTLPESIGDLRHLRYLHLGNNAIKVLPESLCCLYNLQTLKLKGCINMLPQGIGKLIGLRHLEVEPWLLLGVSGLGNLTSLQELESFPISRQADDGPKICDLKLMNELRGSLRIKNLERIGSKEEALGAELKRKQHLLRLEMEWDEYNFEKKKNSKHEERREFLVPPTCLCQAAMKWDGYYFEEEKNIKPLEEILEALVPPTGLRELEMNGYQGVNAPSWLEQHHFLTNLESISLNGCERWSFLPNVFLCAPSLRRLVISDCPQLRHLPTLPITLRELEIRELERLEELPDFYQPGTQSVWGDSSSCISSLRTVVIKGCSALKCLSRGLLRNSLSNLSVIIIQRCAQLVEWPQGTGFLDTIGSLEEELCIESCWRLEAFPAGTTLSPSLKRLKINGCPKVFDDALLAQLQNLASDSSVFVEKDYADLQSCCEQIAGADWLAMGDVRNLGRARIQLTCERQQTWSWRSNAWFNAWTVVVNRKSDEKKEEVRVYPQIPREEWWDRRSREVIMNDRSVTMPEVTNGENQPQMSWSAAVASVVRWLAVEGTFPEPLLPLIKMGFLEGLWISYFNGAPTSLVPETIIPNLSGLLELQIFACPELTFSSLEKVLSSLPSLQHLTIRQCPKLLSTASSISCAPSGPALSSLSSFSPDAADNYKLQTLFVDDAALLGHTRFLHVYLSSLRGLHIWGDQNITSLADTMELESLRSLGRSLQHLSFSGCSNLEHLPSDMRSLFPSLRALSIEGRHKLQGLPALLPASLDILILHGCGGNPEILPNPVSSGIACVPVIVSDGELVQGSYEQFLEFRERWRDF